MESACQYKLHRQTSGRGVSAGKGEAGGATSQHPCWLPVQATRLATKHQAQTMRAAAPQHVVPTKHVLLRPLCPEALLRATQRWERCPKMAAPNRQTQLYTMTSTTPRQPMQLPGHPKSPPSCHAPPFTFPTPCAVCAVQASHAKRHLRNPPPFPPDIRHL
eukprot:353226-Chlamydomonas_euryale.AAC.5